MYCNHSKLGGQVPIQASPLGMPLAEDNQVMNKIKPKWQLCTYNKNAKFYAFIIDPNIL